MGSSEPTALTQLSLDDEDRPRYSLAQLQEYFSLIELPQEYFDSPILSDAANAGTKEHGLPFLNALTRHHTWYVFEIES